MLPAAAGLFLPRSRRNVSPHLQISPDSCKLREGGELLFLSFIQPGSNHRDRERKRTPHPSSSLCLTDFSRRWSPHAGSGLLLLLDQVERNFWRSELSLKSSSRLEGRSVKKRNPSEPERPTWLYCATTKAVDSSLTLIRTKTVRSCLLQFSMFKPSQCFTFSRD